MASSELQEVMMIPSQEWQQLKDYYKGTITQNALLEKAGRLGAEEHVILGDKSIPDSMAVAMVKPLVRERAKLTKRLHTASGPPIEQDLDSLLNSPSEALVKKLLTPKPEPQTPGPQRRRVLPVTPVTKYGKTLKPMKLQYKPSPPPKPKSSGLKQAVIKGAAKGVAKSFGLKTLYGGSEDLSDNSEEEYVELEGSHKKKKQSKKSYPKTKKDKLAIDRPAKRGKLDYEGKEYENW